MVIRKQVTLFSFTSGSTSIKDSWSTPATPSCSTPATPSRAGATKIITIHDEVAQKAPSNDLSRGLLPEQRRPRLQCYPRDPNSKRSFVAEWFGQYCWLEYCTQSNAAFCYPCRIYRSGQKEKTWTEKGFQKWQVAKTTGKGFHRHQSSKDHIEAMASWNDRKIRDEKGKSVTDILVKPDPEHRTWLYSVFTVIQYLVSNGLPLRGDEECTTFSSSSFGGGLFLNTFGDLLFKLNPELHCIAKRLPDNAKYTSPDVQNEVIEIMGEMVAEIVAERCKEAHGYTVLMDGTEDKNGNELEAIVLRFLGKRGVEERTLAVLLAEDRTAQGLFSLLLSTLIKHDISLANLISDCMDGASVNAGWKGGIQQLISEECGRKILYIHCINHKLHLVLKKILTVPKQKEGEICTPVCRVEVQNFFALVGELYTFFKLKEVKKVYAGKSLKRLIETRWSGHLRATKIIKDHLQDITIALKASSTNVNIKPENRMKALGYLKQLEDGTNKFLITFLSDILTYLDIGTQSFQKIGSSLANCMKSLRKVQEQLNLKKIEYSVEKITEIIKAGNEDTAAPSAKRQRKLPARLEDSVMTARAPIFRNEASESVMLLRGLAVDVLDSLDKELTERFSEENVSCWGAMRCLMPSSPEFLDVDSLKPLMDYTSSIPGFDGELGGLGNLKEALFAESRVHKKNILEYMNDFKDELKGKDPLISVLGYLETQGNSAPLLSALLKVGIVCGYSTSTVECVFSARARIDTPHRRRLTPYKQGFLTLLHFEKDITNSLNFIEFLKRWKSLNRRLKV